MKVTKMIKEFVEDSVRDKAYTSATYLQKKKASEEAVAAFEAEMKTFKTEEAERLQVLFDKFGLKEDPQNYVHRYFAVERLCARREFIEYERTIEETIRKKIREILVALELGDTKEDLIKALEEVSFE